MTEAHLNCAKRNLAEEFSLILVQEDLDKGTWNSVLPQIVAKAFGVHDRRAKQLLSDGSATPLVRFKQTSHAARPNAVGGAPPELPEALERAILGMNNLDTEVRVVSLL